MDRIMDRINVTPAAAALTARSACVATSSSLTVVAQAHGSQVQVESKFLFIRLTF